ncbi:hypothetical protein AB1E18_005329 [Capra hircus]
MWLLEKSTLHDSQQGCHLGTDTRAPSPPQEQPQQVILPSASHSTWCCGIGRQLQQNLISALPLSRCISLTASILGAFALQAAPQRRSLDCKGGGLLSVQG